MVRRISHRHQRAQQYSHESVLSHVNLLEISRWNVWFENITLIFLRKIISTDFKCYLASGCKELTVILGDF